MTTSIPLGRYQHYKGPYYQVFNIAKHSETEELLVIYKPEKSEQWWARPLSMFVEDVIVDGKTVKRFKHCPDE